MAHRRPSLNNPLRARGAIPGVALALGLITGCGAPDEFSNGDGSMGAFAASSDTVNPPAPGTASPSTAVAGVAMPAAPAPMPAAPTPVPGPGPVAQPVVGPDSEGSDSTPPTPPDIPEPTTTDPGAQPDGTSGDATMQMPADPTMDTTTTGTDAMVDPTDPVAMPPDTPAAMPAPEPSPQPEPALDPLFADATCTSDRYYRGGENDRMRPGGACVDCHRQEREGPIFSIAGTLYDTGHEPNDCNGVTAASGAMIVIVDANGQELVLEVNEAGNFTSRQQIATPYTASVVTADGERKMLSPQTDGDCNGCHTAEGATGAPGRITMPAL